MPVRTDLTDALLAPVPEDGSHESNEQLRAIRYIPSLFFDALDLGIRALDPNGYQEVLKVYIA